MTVAAALDGSRELARAALARNPLVGDATRAAMLIDALGPSLFPRFPHLDVLVANAGILGPITPVGHIQDKDWAEVLAVNLTANWRLMRTLEPLLRRSDSGRAVFVTSGAATRAQAYWAAYAASKAALDQMVRVWALELASSAVRVNLLSPGPTRTAMRAHAFPGEDPGTLKPPERVAALIVELVSPSCRRHGETVVIPA